MYALLLLDNINHSLGSNVNEEPTISTISTAGIDTNPRSVFGSIYSVPFSFLVGSGSHVTTVSLETYLKIYRSIPAAHSQTYLFYKQPVEPLITKGTFMCSFSNW